MVCIISGITKVGSYWLGTGQPVVSSMFFCHCTLIEQLTIALKELAGLMCSVCQLVESDYIIPLIGLFSELVNLSIICTH